MDGIENCQNISIYVNNIDEDGNLLSDRDLSIDEVYYTKKGE